MATLGGLDIQTVLSQYVDDLNEAVHTRQFPPFVRKWFTDQSVMTIDHELTGIEEAKDFWTFFLPVGGERPREVLQFPYKVENGRVYSWRLLQGGSAAKPMYGLQETQFDEHTMISEMVIRSQPDKPEVETDPKAEKSRLARIMVAFADAFNDYFVEGDTGIFEEWCAPNVHLVIDTSVWGMAIIGPHNRIADSAEFTLGPWELIGDDRIKGRLEFTNWNGKTGANPMELVLTPDGKIQDLHLFLEM